VTIAVVPLSPAIGAEIRGVDLMRPVDAATRAAIHRAWLDHVIILFRDQKLSEGDQVAFTELFGEVGIRTRPKDLRPEAQTLHPTVMLISNIRENGKPIGSLPDGEMMFHHDTIHIKTPDKATCLYAMELPSRGGNTLFANLYKAYDALPARIRDRLADKKAHHHYNYGTTVKGDRRGTEAFGESVHPVFWRHPETGQRAVYVDRLMTEYVLDIARAESDALLAEIFDHCERPEFVYEHQWRVGDLVMWDNRCSMHARTDFPETERRLLRRTTVRGHDVPVS